MYIIAAPTGQAVCIQNPLLTGPLGSLITLII
jgi:hypothetical protein